MEDIKLKPFLQTVNGIRIPGRFKPESLIEAMEYKPRPDDVFIVTYPKCGTTWMQMIVFNIINKGQEVNDYEDFFKRNPFIDRGGLSSIRDMPHPGVLKTHLPYNRVPYSPEAKYIFVLRNPKDTCVSFFYHTKSGIDNGYSEGVFDDFFELFMTGEIEYGDYFDHLQSWYTHRNDKGIFYTTFEDMKANLRDVVLRLAEFLGQEYTDAIEKDNNVLKNILHYSDFDYMKENLVNESDNVATGKEKEADSKSPDEEHMKRKGFGKTHFRKGVVGDWQSHFSEEQSKRLNQKFFVRFGGTEMYEKYKAFL